MVPGSVNLPRRVSSGKVDWTKSVTGRLIELYKRYSDIWDSSSEMYSDRQHRKKLMEKIAEEMQIDVRDVCSKIHNIRCQYNSEIRKIRRGKNRSGTVLAHNYIPKWEFFETLSFLENATKKKPTFKTEADLNDIISMDYGLQESSHSILHENNFIEEHVSDDIDIKDIPSDNIIITKDDVLQNSVITNIKLKTAMRSKSPSPKRRKAEKAKIIKKNREVSNDEVMANAMKTLSSAYDSHKIFCEYLADEMRNMSDRKCKKLKKIIQKAIVQLEEDTDEDPLYM